jgi:hypothetical protein
VIPAAAGEASTQRTFRAGWRRLEFATGLQVCNSAPRGFRGIIGNSMMRSSIALPAGLFLLVTVSFGADVPVPSSCTPDVNARLAQLIQAGTHANVDNVMVCGITTTASHPQKPGEHGGHQILSVRVQLPGIGARLIQIAINDDLDGVVNAPANASVFAFGQAYFDNTGKFAAGIHDVHCSTHSGADNGWVVVNGKKNPAVPCQ